ncbi:glutamyl-tRNA amidotransferase [Orenia metallireducens]|uniref:Glutamyl-tRNA amidotransferase n=1 Tax=Orenia metallireducens TaxID=1413210 RepID=A0A1C0A503_9FIRM|nr:GatB/YqeY domain-containing protein [Orenia metallireducens]OCL25220.1 glutamyl-tRNA amidotransferase [Orenia metallireducens]
MSLQERLLEDMKTAMKSKDKERLSVIRMARAAIKDKEINERKDLTDEEVIEVLAKLVKQNKDSITEYEKAGQEDKVKDLENEIAILQDYLPKQLSEEELVEIVEEVIAETKAESMRDMGKVMGVIMPKVTGRADGNVISQLVKERLA